MPTPQEAACHQIAFFDINQTFGKLFIRYQPKIWQTNLLDLSENPNERKTCGGVGVFGLWGQLYFGGAAFHLGGRPLATRLPPTPGRASLTKRPAQKGLAKETAAAVHWGNVLRHTLEVCLWGRGEKERRGLVGRQGTLRPRSGPSFRLWGLCLLELPEAVSSFPDLLVPLNGKVLGIPSRSVIFGIHLDEDPLLNTHWTTRLNPRLSETG